MHWFVTRLLALFAAVVFLTSCGGGGGGGDSISFSADRSRIDFEFSTGESPGPEAVVISARGTWSGDLYVGAVVEGEGIDPEIPLDIIGLQGTFSVSVLPGLAEGTYSGRLLLMACSDPYCDQQVGNSPVVVRYSIRVLPPLAVTPSPLELDGASGTTAVRTLAVQVPGPGGFAADVTSGGAWLHVTNLTATSFDLAFDALPSGTWEGTVQVTAGTRSASVPVTYRVSAPLGGDRPLAASPASVTLATVEGASTAPTLVTVTAPSWNPAVTAVVEYTGAGGWLQVTPVAGGFQLVGNAGNLLANGYGAHLRVRGAWPAEDVLVPVSFTVGRGIAVPPTEVVAVRAETTADQLHRSVPVIRAGGAPVNWTATSNAAWATLGQSSGVTGDNLGIAIDPGFVASLPNGAVRTATLTITPAVPNISAVSFDLVLTRDLPELHRVGPYVQLAGLPSRMLVRGSGLAAVASLADRIVVEGGTIQSAVLRGDREAELHVGPLSAGTHAISVTNALGLATPAATLKVVTPPVYDYAAVPTGHPLRYLTYDAERSAVYATDLTAQALVRFRSTPSGWTTDSVPVPAIYDAGLTQDGSTLLVSTNNFQTVSTLRSLDPDTLAQRDQFIATSTFNPTFTYLGFGISSTLDGLAWFGLDDFPGSGQWADLVSFDPVSQTLSSVNVGLTTTFHGGPWFAASRDGGRLVIVQSASISPSPPLLYRDSSDGVVRINPAGLQFSFRLSLSDDARRIMLDNYEVRDQNFALVGRIQLPSGRAPVTGQMHPNGTRAYVVATDSNGDDWRVYVVDTAAYVAELPVLGYFALPDPPGCMECQSQTFPSAISPDGSTLFVAGNTHLVVMPIPEVLAPAAARVAPLAATVATPETQRPRRMTPWRLPTGQ